MLVFALLASLAEFFLSKEQKRKLNALRRATRPHAEGVFEVILPNNQPDFGFRFKTGTVTDEENEVITDESKLSLLVKEVSSADDTVISVSLTEGKTDEGTIHVGHSGSATLFGKIWKDQAAKDAGADPLHVASHVFTITTGDPAGVTESDFEFDATSQGSAPVVEA